MRQQESVESRLLSWWQLFRLAGCVLTGELDWTVVFRGGGGRGGGGAERRPEGQAGQMEDGAQHLGHCIVDIKEMSADPEGLTAAGKLTALCCLSVSSVSSTSLLCPSTDNLTSCVLLWILSPESSCFCKSFCKCSSQLLHISPSAVFALAV